MITSNIFIPPTLADSADASAKEDWKAYATAASISLSSGFREASKRMVKQSKALVCKLPQSAYRDVAANICDMITAVDRRRMLRANVLKQMSIDTLKSISGSESVELKTVLEQVLVHLKI